MATGKSIKLFVFIRNYLSAIGVRRPKPKQFNSHFFNSTNWIFILNGTPMLISSLAFFAYRAKTVFDFGLSFYYSSCLICGGIFYIIQIWEIENVSKFIKNCEAFIEQRKDKQLMNHPLIHTDRFDFTGLRSSTVYRMLNDKIKTICEWFFVILLGELVFSSICVFIYSAVNYFVFNSGKESFLLCNPNV